MSCFELIKKFDNSLIINLHKPKSPQIHVTDRKLTDHLIKFFIIYIMLLAKCDIRSSNLELN